MSRASSVLIAITVATAACGIGGDERDEPGELILITNVQDAPAWAVPFGEETWSSSGVNINRAIERVQHAIRRDPTTGVVSVKGRGYTAAFDGGGLRFSSGSDARLHTTRIAFGDEVAYEPHATVWSVLGNTAQAKLAPTIVEHYETLADGVELAWVVRERRAGRLTIDVDIDGVTTVGTSDGRIDLVDSGGTVHAHIGIATLVDANGDRWPVEAEARSGGVRWSVGADVIAGAAFPIAVDPLIGPEILVVDPVLATSQRDQMNPSVAASASGYLAVWSDYQGEPAHTRAARISSSGVLLDPAGIALAPGAPTGGPRVASNGTDFLVVTLGAGIEAQRVSAGGVLLDPTPIIVSTYTYGVAIPGVASNGTDYLVSWATPTTNVANYLYASRVTAGGVVQDPNGIAITTVANESQWFPAIASNGSTYLVAWGRNIGFEPRRIYAARVGFDGTVIDPNGFVLSTAAGGQAWPAVTSNGTDYFVAWEDNRNGNGGDDETDVYGTRVSGSGQVLDPAGVAVSTGAATQTRPRLAWNGSNYVAVWEDDRSNVYLYYDIYAARVAPNGSVVDPSGLVVASGRSLRVPAVASHAGNYLVIWHDLTGPNGDIYAQRFTGALEPIEAKPFPVALSPNAYAPAIASNGTTYLVAWADARAFETTGVDIMGTRMSSAGAVLDPAGIVISNASGRQSAPAIASNGTDYLVAWEDGRVGERWWDDKDVYAARVSAAGSVIDPAGIAVCAAPHAQDMIAIASDGANYLLAWVDDRASTSFTTSNVYTARVTSAGALPDGSGVELAPVSRYLYPLVSLASNGSSYLLAYGDYVRRLTTGGVPDTAPVNVSYAIGGHSPSVASNGTDYLTAWATDRGNTPPLWATRISAAGTLMDPSAIQLPAPVDAREPAVASNGSSYLVAWHYDDFGGPALDILAARIGVNGALWDTTALSVAVSSARETNPAVAYNAASGGFAIAYEARQLSYVRLLGWSCGDGVLDGDEACDDDGGTAGDGCSASCAVEAGYTCTGSPSTCSDVNECATNNGGCSPNATCTNTPGSFTCTCMEGYSGDGVTCVDVDECATNNGGCSVDAICTNSVGSHTCACNAGFEGDGVTCSDIDECATANGGCAGTCTNTAGSYTCACPPGFALDANGYACNDIDECATDNGGCTGACTNTAGSYTCACPPGFVLDADGHACNDIDECATDNGGCAQLCINTTGSFSCACQSGYALAADGLTCDEEPADPDGGCGCRTSESSHSLAFLLVLGGVLRRRRR